MFVSLYSINSLCYVFHLWQVYIIGVHCVEFIVENDAAHTILRVHYVSQVQRDLDVGN